MDQSTRLLLLAALLLGPQVPSMAQSTAQSAAQSALQSTVPTAPGAPKYLGTYHPATKSWSRPRTQTALGSAVLYNNATPPTAVRVMPDDALIPFSLTDHGRIPSTSSTGDGDSYTVNGLTFGYASAAGIGPGLTATYELFESAPPCAAPSGSPATAIVVSGLPTSAVAGVSASWILTIDLSGTTQEATLAGDGDGQFDGNAAQDDFGVRVRLSGHGTDQTTGVLIAGDPQLYPEGDGTTNFGYGPGPDGTGLGQQDSMWIESSFPPGSFCDSLSAYPNDPWAGVYLRLHGEARATDLAPDRGIRASDIELANIGNGLYNIQCRVYWHNKTGATVELDTLVSASVNSLSVDTKFIDIAGDPTPPEDCCGSFICVSSLHSCVEISPPIGCSCCELVNVNFTGINLQASDVLTIEIQAAPGSFPDGSTGNNTATITIQPRDYCSPAPANSVALSGARLEAATAFGTATATFDVLDIPNQPGLLFTGTSEIQLPFGCGERCVGGAVLRGPVLFPSGNQLSSVPYDMSVGGQNIQYWYRDPANFANCGAGFNLSNALAP